VYRIATKKYERAGEIDARSVNPLPGLRLIDQTASTPPYHGGFALPEGDRGTPLVTAFSLQLGHFVCLAHPFLEEP
jgi:hypothetical protein